MVSTTQTQSQIESQEFIGHIQKHFITTRLLAVITNGIHDFGKMLYQTLGAPRPLTCQHAIWWTTTISIASVTMIYYLVYCLQRKEVLSVLITGSQPPPPMHICSGRMKEGRKKERKKEMFY